MFQKAKGLAIYLVGILVMLVLPLAIKDRYFCLYEHIFKMLSETLVNYFMNFFWALLFPFSTMASTWLLDLHHRTKFAYFMASLLSSHRESVSLVLPAHFTCSLGQFYFLPRPVSIIVRYCSFEIVVEAYFCNSRFPDICLCPLPHYL